MCSTIALPISWPPMRAYGAQGTSQPNSSAIAVSTTGIERPTAAKAVA